jgi:Transposase domain (DUF772)
VSQDDSNQKERAMEATVHWPGEGERIGGPTTVTIKATGDETNDCFYLGEVVVEPGFPGPPPHVHEHLHDMFAYAYAVGERSSRGIERRCREDVAFRVICANQVPDHATIARFRVRHEEALAELFGGVLGLCAKAGIVDVGVIAVDGTKLAANASDGGDPHLRADRRRDRRRGRARRRRRGRDPGRRSRR